jgi:aspartyl-tRNA synthetase
MESLTAATEKVANSIERAENTKTEESASEPSKNALKKAAKELEKQKKKAEKAAKQAAKGAAMEEEDSVDHSEGYYGNLPLIQSTTRTGKTLTG